MIKHFLTCTLILLAIGCASVSTPLGGEKDDQNPTLITSTPKDQTINFTQKDVQLEFTEWIKIDQLNKKLIITPRTNVEYEYTNKKNLLTLKFKDKLADSTTYTLNFRDAIKDITEGNVWEDSKIAFSTGNYLDSMSVRGTIESLFTQSPSENYLVGLYSAKIDTANLRQGLPLYLTSTDKEGKFNISNIKKGTYRLYAFNDKNNDLINNPATESYAYLNELLSLTDSAQTVAIKSYYSNEDTLKVKNIGPSGKDYKISVNKGIKAYQIHLLEQNKAFIYSGLTNENKEIIIYRENFPDLAADSLQATYSITDSIGQHLTDTFYIKLRESKITNETIKVTKKPNTEITSGSQFFEIQFNKPIKYISTDSLYVGLNDSIILYMIPREDITLNEHKNRLTLSTELYQTEIDSLINYHQKNIENAISDTSKIDSLTTINKENQTNMPSQRGGIKTSKNLKPYLISKKGSFTGIELDTVSSFKYAIEFKNIENYGTIEGAVDTTNMNYIVELTDEKNALIDSIKTVSVFKFNYVKPGKYKIRVIVDENENGEWDKGNPLTLDKHEQIIHYNEVITVKANWEILDIIITANTIE